ncbi:MAG: triose-phosphate isomerase [Clostridiales bacterium]|nr:triose-phosphate isomerase [Clostridiales bacterium]
MKKIRTPFFEIGTKNYIYGDDVLKLAMAADKMAEKYDIDVLMTTPYADIRRVAENTKNLIIIAPYMDTLYPGRGMAAVLPESLKAAGAHGVVINHCEKPMSLPQMKDTIKRAREMDFIVFACADTTAEAQALAHLKPDIINPEPSELIGGNGGQVSDMGFVKKTIDAIKAIDPEIYVEQAAGITTGEQVYDFIMAGSEGAGAASGICNAADPIKTMEEMIAATRRAADDLKKLGK